MARSGASKRDPVVPPVRLLQGIGWGVCLAAGMAGAADAVNESRYPSRPVRLLVPFAPGGGNDFLARLVGQKLGEQMKQPFVVDNRPGAGGIIATDLVAKSAPDGYTLLLGFIGPLAISPNLEKVPYDPVRDFAAASMLASIYHVLVATPSLQARTVKELIALAQAKPGAISFASAGYGTPPHLIGELLKSAMDVSLVHIPYKGASPAAIALLSGEAHMLFASMSAVSQHVRANRLLALAVTSPGRSTVFPEVPTLAEAGVNNVEVGAWYALVAPAATPLAVLARLNAEMTKVAVTPDYRQQLTKQAFEPLAGNPKNFPAFVSAELVKWGSAVKAGKVRLQ